MKNIMFPSFVYQYAVKDWHNKKNLIQSCIKEENFEKKDNFSTDRQKSKNSYLDSFKNIFSYELEMFENEINVGVKFSVIDVWSVKYYKGDFHPTHNHSSSGYSGILYLNYDENEHSGTYFVNNQVNPISDLTDCSLPIVYEGSITLVPSYVLHYTRPNLSNKIRQVIGFDLKIKK